MLGPDEEAEVRAALRYIAQPTCGYPAMGDFLDFIENHATDENVRLALLACVRIAKRVLHSIEEEQPQWD